MVVVVEGVFVVPVVEDVDHYTEVAVVMTMMIAAAVADVVVEMEVKNATSWHYSFLVVGVDTENR